MEEYFRNMKFRLAEPNIISWYCIRSAFRGFEVMKREMISRQETFYDNITRSNTEHGYMINLVDPMDGSKSYYEFHSKLKSKSNDHYVIEDVTKYDSWEQLLKDDKLLYSGPLINKFKVDISGRSAVLMLQTPIRISLETYCFDRDRFHPVRFIVVKDDKSCENLSRQGEKFDFSDFMSIKEIIEQNFGNVASLSVETLSEIGFNLP